MPEAVKRLLLLGLAGFLLAGLPGCASDDEKVAQHVTESERYLAEGDNASAIVELKSALGIQPKSALLNRRLAQVYGALGNQARAAFYYGETYRLDPTQTDAALLQAPALYGTDVDGAEALVREVLDQEPENPDAHSSLAEVLLLRGDTDAALRSALTATELEPDSVRAHRMVTSVHRSRIRDALLRNRKVDDSIFEAALASAERAGQAVKEGQQPGAWYDFMEQALVYTEWEGHQHRAKAAIRIAYKLADDQDIGVGRRVVSREARRIAVTENDFEFRRWALERWVEVEPESIQAWRRLAMLTRDLDGSGDPIWERALAARSDDVRMHAEYVRVLERLGRPEEARAHLAALPPELEESVEVRGLRVEMALSKGELEEAGVALADAKALHPNEPLIRLLDAAYDLRVGRVQQGLEALRVLAGEVERADVFRLLASAEARVGNRDAGLAAVERALDLAPAASVAAHKLRLGLLAGQQDWLGVLRAWRDMRRMGMQAGNAGKRLRIQALYETARPAVARRLLDQALEADRPSPRLALLFARYEGRRQPERARKLLERAWENDPDDLALTRALAQIELASGDRAAALRWMQAYEKRTGKRANPVLEARSLLAMGREEEAEQAAIRAFSNHPRPFGASILLVEILTARGKEDEAIRLLTEARDDGSLMPAGLWQLGRLHYAHGDLEAALPPIEEAYERNPQLAPALGDLALVLAELGRDLDRAVDLARRAKAQNPENPSVADTLGYVYLRKGLAEPAAFEFRSAIELARVQGAQHAELHYHLGLALKAQGRLAEARQSFGDALRIEPGHAAAQEAYAQVQEPAPDAG